MKEMQVSSSIIFHLCFHLHLLPSFIQLLSKTLPLPPYSQQQESTWDTVATPSLQQQIYLSFVCLNLHNNLEDFLYGQHFSCYLSNLTCKRQGFTHLFCSHAGAFPIVEVILQVSITNSKFQLFQEGLVFHKIQGIENIKTLLQKEAVKENLKQTKKETHQFGQYESIIHEVNKRCFGVDIVERIGCLQTLVCRMIHNGGGQCVETQEICHLPISVLVKTIRFFRINFFSTFNQRKPIVMLAPSSAIMPVLHSLA
ncbi:hypothetical protein E2320_002627 [Naja naja]|nr:hypothetical protein E2320_002627 [Naja naja]